MTARGFGRGVALLGTGCVLIPVRAQADQFVVGVGATTVRSMSGESADLSWVHPLPAGRFMNLGATGQYLGGAHWVFATAGIGAVETAESLGKWSLTAQLQEGTGRVVDHSFRYQVGQVTAAVGMTRPLSLELADRQFDIDTTHGNLPSIGVALGGGTKWLVDLQHGNSIGGDLGTTITTIRVDRFSSRIAADAGVSFGRIRPAAVALPTTAQATRGILREAYLGCTWHRVGRDLLITLDRLRLDDTVRWTLSIDYEWRR